MRIASVQVAIKPRSKADSLTHVLNLLDEARGNDLILLPEMWPCGYFNFERYAADSEPLDGPTVQGVQEKARELTAYLHVGSFVERDGDNLYNTSLLLDERGEVVARYRKIQLFGYLSQEPHLLKRGDEVTVVATPWGFAGLSICYDLRFPELYRRMIDRGAEYFLVSSAWPGARLESWRLFNRARANENLAYLFSCNCAGAEGLVTYAGHSMFVDPLGNVLAEGGDGEETVAADVKLEPGLAIRKQFFGSRRQSVHGNRSRPQRRWLAMPIPHADAAYIPREKLIDYLLNEQHPAWRKRKPRWFRSLGYELAAPTVLERDLYDLVHTSDDYTDRHSPYGTKFIVSGRIR